MKKRLIALLLVSVLSVSLFGCTPKDNSITTEPEITMVQTDPTLPESVKGYDKVDPQVLSFSTDLYSAVTLSKGYESLKNDAQRQCYRLMEESVFYISQESDEGVYRILPVTVSSGIEEAELHLIISAFTFDHPEIFWIDNSFSYYSTSGTTYLRLTSNMNAQQVNEGAKKMYAELREIFSAMPGNLSEFDRELFIHDRFIERCVYADEALRAQNNPEIYTSYGAIVNSVAVCEGYSRAMQLMLSLVGIENYYVYGRGNSELHMWNSVRLGDNWYFLDATWNDKGNRGSAHNYFNITTEQLLKDHYIAPLYDELSADEVCGSGTGIAVNFNLFVPECNSENMSFYSHNAISVTGFDDENLDRIAQGFADAANNREEAVYLYIDPYYLDFETAKDNFFYSGDYAIFTCISRANNLLSGVTIRNDYLQTEESVALSILIIYPEYE